jgi:hypothetical protein
MLPLLGRQAANESIYLIHVYYFVAKGIHHIYWFTIDNYEKILNDITAIYEVESTDEYQKDNEKDKFI